MIKVIEHGRNIRRVACDKCGCLVEYNKTLDVVLNTTDEYDTDWYIECPECNSMICVE